jgi:uncharacterized damage-inducible protein DinB
MPATAAEVLQEFALESATTRRLLERVPADQLKWKPHPKSRMVLPKGILIRSLALNHLYHHRGQLSVYLRLLNVPVPAIYGPSADENPMASGQA